MMIPRATARVAPTIHAMTWRFPGRPPGSPLPYTRWHDL